MRLIITSIIDIDFVDTTPDASVSVDVMEQIEQSVHSFVANKLVGTLNIDVDGMIIESTEVEA